jgi:hypothetical protein
VAREIEQLPPVLLGQVRHQEPQTRQVDLPGAHALQDLREAARRARDLDALVRDGLGEAQHLDAVVEERAEALLDRQTTSVDLAEVHEQFGFELGVPRAAGLQSLEQDVIGNATQGEGRERHDGSFPG